MQGIGREAMVASFYHEGYEDPLLKLIRRRGVQAGLVVKVRVMFCHAQCSPIILKSLFLSLTSSGALHLIFHLTVEHPR